QDLLHQGEVIHDRLEIIRARAPQVIQEYQQRLHQRITELAAEAKLQVQQQDLIREVAVFAERSDISEELSRVAGHLDQLQQVVRGERGKDPTGRTIDFLAQELLREANTIASKSSDAEISRAAVDIKSAIDRIKEQAQNVE
ncbi:MAG: endoribonuclease YicC domain-containing protein, partial [Phycisphaeraceae bacterium]